MKRYFGALAAAALAALGLCGCAGSIPVKTSTVEADLPAKEAPIEDGKSDRAAVRQLLGEPWLTSDYWRFDLFRVSDSDVSAPLMFVFWWPVPLGVSVSQVTGYVLVTYDAEGRVVRHAHDFARDASAYELGGPDTAAWLDAGDLRFGSDQDEKDAYLSVAARQRDEYLSTYPSPDQCRVLIGCEGYGVSMGVGMQFAMDGAAPIAMPGASAPFHGALALVQVRPGRHSIEIDPTSSHLEFQAASVFDCAAGETLYGLVGLEIVKRSLFSEKWRATLTVSPEMPESLRDHWLLVWGEGKWMVPVH